MTRRFFLQRMGSLALLQGSTASNASEKNPDKENNCNKFGAAVREEFLQSNDTYRNAVLRYCSHVTPELEFKWSYVETNEGLFDFSAGDKICNFAEKNNIGVYGHTLLWHRSTPDWAASQISENKNWKPIERYISAIMKRYSGIKYWDVVNEPIDTGFRQDGLRANSFLLAFGESYISRALFSARAAAPHAQLMINEYGLEYDYRIEEDRRYLFLKLLERLKKENVPLDGVGLQAHLDLRKGKVSQQHISAFMTEIADLGLSVFITELDVIESRISSSVAERDVAVASEVDRYLDVVLSFENVRGLTTWGLSDRFSWLGIAPFDIAHYKNNGYWQDGTGPGLNRGLPFDSDFVEKPFYDVVAASVKRIR